MGLNLTMTCGPYDRARALIDGTVKPEGINLEVYVNKDPGRDTEIDGREFDIAEFYSGLYIADLQYKSLGTPLFLFSSSACFAILIFILTSAPAFVHPLT